MSDLSDVVKHVYDLSEGSAAMKPLLGGKGANVAEMKRIGVPVPDGFTVTTQACVEAMRRGGEWPEGLWESIEEGLTRLEERTGRVLGAAQRPLLVSVRSGAVHSMPGMMDTILNLGITDESVVGLGAEAESPRFAWDSYRRFIQMYGEVVESVPSHVYDDALVALKSRRGVSEDTDLTADDLQELVATFKDLSREHMGEELPAGPPRAAAPLDRRRVPVLAQPPRRGLPPGQQHPRRPRHGREHHADGLRQPRRHVRDRGLLHPQPLHGRQGAVRRVPRQRPGRGRGGRHPHPAPAGRDGVGAARGLQAAARHHGARSSSTTATCRTSSSPSSRARSTCCRPATASAPPRRPLQVVSDLVAEGVIDRHEALRRVEPDAARPAAAPGHRPQPRARGR